MKSRTLMFVTAMTLFAALAIPLRLAAQGQVTHFRHYKLFDVGTFGGPASYLAFSNGVTSPGAINQILNNQGTVVGWADTATPDPLAPNCFSPFNDCFLSHAFQWKKGVLTNLGVLPGGDGSFALWISDNGLIAGEASNGILDPLFPGFAEGRAVLWKDGQILDLGTLGGNESSAFSVNNRGQVVGVAVNTIPDPFSFFGTELRAFLWQDGAMQDLGTLGGPEAWALFVNERGQVAGFATTNAVFNPITLSLTTDPFLWEHGTMRDLGTLGGTLGFPYGLNNQGQVVGTSNLAGDLTSHPFLWKRGSLVDLGTLGGSFGIAMGINEAGEVVGFTTTEGDATFHATLWKDGTITDLGVLDDDCFSSAGAINSKGLIVGASVLTCNPDAVPGRAVLWDKEAMVDLNTLIPANSSLHLIGATNINDRGEIAGEGLAGCNVILACGHAFLLIPVCEDGTEGCADAPLDPAVVAQSRAASTATPKTMTPEQLAAFKKRIARMSSRIRLLREPRH